MKIRDYLLVILELIAIIMLGILINKTNYRPEDVNKDGKLDILDLLKVQKYILGDNWKTHHNLVYFIRNSLVQEFTRRSKVWKKFYLNQACGQE